MGRLQSTDPWRLVSVVSLVLLLLYAVFLAAAARFGLWIIGPQGLVPLDFSEFWAAGRLAATGKAASAYSWPSLRALLQHHSGADFTHAHLPFYYPPMLLLPLSLVMAAPPFVAALIWIGGGAIAYLGAVWAICRRPVLVLAAAAAPAALLTVCIGQNGLLSAALLGGGLALLDRRPVVAGLLIGALAYKPQFGLLLPLVLVATGRWRVILSAAATVLALVAASGLIFGWGVFAAFLQATRMTHGQIPALVDLAAFKLQSVYGLARVLGAPTALAWGAQLLAALGGAGFTLALWRSPRGLPLKAAALAASVLLVSPYSAVYDLTLPVIAIAFLLADPTQPPGRVGLAVLAGAYAAPMIFPFLAMPLGPFICLAILTVTAQRWRSTSRAPAASASPVDKSDGTAAARGVRQTA